MQHLSPVSSDLPKPICTGLCVRLTGGAGSCRGRQAEAQAGSRYSVEKLSTDCAQNHLGVLLKRRFLFIPS